jgi:hypothetical protein
MRDDIEQLIRERAYHMWRENGSSDDESDRNWPTICDSRPLTSRFEHGLDCEGTQ